MIVHPRLQKKSYLSLALNEKHKELQPKDHPYCIEKFPVNMSGPIADGVWQCNLEILHSHILQKQRKNNRTNLPTDCASLKTYFLSIS